MKKLVVLLGIILLASCSDYGPSKRAAEFEAMTPPIVVIAKNPRVEPKMVEGEEVTGVYGSILLRDSAGVTVAFKDNEMYGAALCGTYEVGDTIK